MHTFRQRPNKNRLFYGSLLSPNRESEPSLSPLLRNFQASLLENICFLSYYYIQNKYDL